MSAFSLKIIALFTMVIDHIGAVFFSNYLIFRYIGRIAFPIFAFLVSEGCKNTKNFEKYLSRLLVFALISEFFYDLVFNQYINYIDNTNTLYTLFFSSLIIYYFKSQNKFKIILIILNFIIVNFLNTDYGVWGVILILLFYFAKNKVQAILFSLFWIIVKYNTYLNSTLFLCTISSLIFIYFYNGKEGKKIKYLFYIAYPLHLFLIVIFRYLIW